MPMPLSAVSSRRLWNAALLMGSLGGASLGCAHGQPVSSAPVTAPPVPPALVVPAGATPKARFHAVGEQVYTCGAATPGGPTASAWTLKRPDAALFDDAGRPAGTHGAGPTWTSADGSSVVGKKLAQADAPEPAAIPWLLVGAVSNAGTGLFTDVTYVQRVSTKGGKAPTTECGVANVGAEARVPYAADYYFFSGGRP